MIGQDEYQSIRHENVGLLLSETIQNEQFYRILKERKPVKLFQLDPCTWAYRVLYLFVQHNLPALGTRYGEVSGRDMNLGWTIYSGMRHYSLGYYCGP